jgi:hypothetical protein
MCMVDNFVYLFAVTCRSGTTHTGNARRCTGCHFDGLVMTWSRGVDKLELTKGEQMQPRWGILIQLWLRKRDGGVHGVARLQGEVIGVVGSAQMAALRR